MKISAIDAFIAAQEGLVPTDRAAIEKMQLQRLNRLLAREKARGGFYSALPGRLDSLEELKDLPFTTEEDLAQNAFGLLLCSQADIQRVLSDATSGTTGAAKRVFYTERDCENTVALFTAGLSELVFPGSVTMICMPFSGPNGLGELIARAISALGARPLKVGAGRRYAELGEILRREQPDTYVGMPVPLLSLLRFQGRGSLERALVSGDSCPERLLRECSAILGSELFPHYGSREMGLGGAICCSAHRGMHLRENHVIAEIVDSRDRPLPDGEFGELVISTIGMEAMPLIRYKTGDRSRVLPGPCPCGSRVKRLDSVERLGDAALMLRLDQELFQLPGLIDYLAERREGGLFIKALTDGSPLDHEIKSRAEKLLSREEVRVQAKKATSQDRPLYAGKRRLLGIG